MAQGGWQCGLGSGVPIAEPEQVQDEKERLRVQIGGRNGMGEEQPTGTEVAWELED